MARSSLSSTCSRAATASVCWIRDRHVYEFFLTNLNSLSTVNPFYLIGTDGNLIPHPVKVQSVRIGPAERVDVIIDFSKFAGQTLYLENRLNQLNGQGPAAVDSQVAAQNATSTECTLALNSSQPAILPAGAGAKVLQFRVSNVQCTDDSVDPATNPSFYSLPSTTATPRIVRTFKFD